MKKKKSILLSDSTGQGMTGGETEKAEQAEVTPQTLTITKDRLREWRGPSTCPFSEWQLEADAALAENGLNKKPTEAAGYLIRKIKGDAAKEVRLEKATCSKSPAELFRVLAEAYGSGKSGTTLLREFYNRKQKSNERILVYSHALGDLMEELQEVDKGVDSKKRGSMLARQFAENVSNGQLRWELQKLITDDPEIPFMDLRKIAMKYEADDARVGVRSAVLEEQQVMADRINAVEQKFCQQQEHIKDMMTHQTELMEKMTASFQQACSLVSAAQQPQYQQPILPNVQQPYLLQQGPPTGSGYRGPDEWKKKIRCHWCREFGHLKRECPGFLTWKANQGGPTPAGNEGGQ